MNLVVPQDEKEKVIDAFIDKLYAPGAQGLYKGDPERDILEKNTALNYALKTLNITPHKDLEQMRQDYKSSYKVSESINEAEVVQSKRKGIVHLEKMKDSDFLNLLDELKNSAILFDNMVIRPIQDLLIESFDKILAFNGISLKLFFKTLQPLEFTDLENAQTQEQVAEETGTNLSKDEFISNLLIEAGEDINENWLLIDESEVDYEIGRAHV